MIYKNLLLISFLLSLISCREQNKNDCDFFIRSVPIKMTIENYHTIFSMGKKAIPCLIDLIDTNNKELIVGFQDPMSSTLHPFMTNYVGIKYAYLVEYILSKDSIEPATGNTWADTIKPYRIYNYGIIVRKTKNGKPVFEPLTLNDIKAIKEIYCDWWKRNKDKPIEILRKEWQEGRSILKGNYTWI